MKKHPIFTTALLTAILITSISVIAHSEEDPFENLDNTDNLSFARCDKVTTSILEENDKTLIKINLPKEECLSHDGAVKFEIVDDDGFITDCRSDYWHAARRYMSAKCDISDTDANSILIHHMNKAGSKDLYTRVDLESDVENNGNNITTNRPTFTGVHKFNPDDLRLADPDSDGDGVPDSEDECPGELEVLAAGEPVDGVMDGCPTVEEEEEEEVVVDQDVDDDGVLNEEDNCPFTSNEDQGDEDLDSIGDACDPDFGNSVEPPIMEMDGGSCSLVDSNTTNALPIILLLTTLLPMTIKRRFGK